MVSNTLNHFTDYLINHPKLKHEATEATHSAEVPAVVMNGSPPMQDPPVAMDTAAEAQSRPPLLSECSHSYERVATMLSIPEQLSEPFSPHL